MRVLIDTNICLDAAMRRQPFASDAIEILSRSEMGEVQGYLSAHSFDTLFYLLTKSYDYKIAYSALKGLRKAVQVAPVTEKVIDDALFLNWKDFEDAVHHECAKESKCNLIISRNKKDFSNSDLPVLEPDEFLSTYFRK